MTPLELAMFPITGWKPGQWDLITRIVCSPKKYVVLEAPTGTGKSVVALGVARMLGGQTRILTGHKNLQDQYATMLALPTVRGRGNFPCPEEPGSQADAAVCSVGGPCHLKRVPQQKTVMVDGRPKTVTIMTGKPGCPYYDQKLEGQEADVSVLNYAYWLAQVNYAGSFAQPDLLICDEAHILEEEIRRFATLDFRRSHMKLLGISYPKARDDAEKWKRWARKFVVSQASAYDEQKKKRSGFMNRTARRSHRALMTLYENAVTLTTAALPEDGWTIRETPFGAEARPVWITPLTQKLFLRHTQKVLFMSATILSGELFAHQLGIDPKDIEFIQAPCPFPKKNRPIYYQPVGKINRNADLTELVRAVDTLLENHPGERGLVHTVSYKIARVILAQSKYPERLFSHETSGEKDGALDRFRATPGAVMVSPSVTTGVDLPYDLCLREGTRVWYDDLSWRPIETVKAGDRILALDEEATRPQAHRALRYTTVEKVGMRTAPVYRVHTTKGDLYATEEHPVLAMRGSYQYTRWRPVGQLKIGDKLRWFTTPVAVEQSRDAGYLAGFYDGEGTLDNGNRDTGYTRLAIDLAQSPGPTLDHAVSLLHARGFETNTYIGKGMTGSPVAHVKIAGSSTERFRFLSQIRPERLISRLNMDGVVGNGGFSGEVLSIEPAGDAVVYNLQTDRRTYIAEGFAVHNCRFQVICKLSFPDLGDPQIKKRMALGPDGEPDPLAKRWYTWHAACALVQAYGRGVRAEDDSASCYILDGNWRWFRQAAKDLVPGWFTEAIVKPASAQSVYVDELFRETPMAAVG